LDVVYITKIVKYKDKMENITSATEGADIPKHMSSDHTNMAECFWTMMAHFNAYDTTPFFTNR
jgi:hypothetical protein